MQLFNTIHYMTIIIYIPWYGLTIKLFYFCTKHIYSWLLLLFQEENITLDIKIQLLFTSLKISSAEIQKSWRYFQSSDTQFLVYLLPCLYDSIIFIEMISIQSLDLLLPHAHLYFIYVIISISCKWFTKAHVDSI